jgi:hypothetical protein
MGVKGCQSENRAKEKERMAAVYANKWIIETNDMSRIVFVDERVPIKPGMPMPSTTAAEVVMTHANFIALVEHMSKVAQQLAGKNAK